MEKPTRDGNVQLSINNGLTPRGKFPKLKVVPIEHERQSAANAYATPPPISFPWTAANVYTAIYQIFVVTPLANLKDFSIAYFLLGLQLVLPSCRPPVQK